MLSIVGNIVGVIKLASFFFVVGRDVCVFYFQFLCFKRFLKQMKDKGWGNGRKECYESHDKFWHWSWIWVTFRISQNPTSQRQAQWRAKVKMTLISRASSMASQRQDDLKDKLYYYQITYSQVFLKQMSFKVHICEIYL